MLMNTTFLGDSFSIKWQSRDVAETLSDAFEKIDRASPIEHPVSGYDRIQNGKKVHVNPYTRGGKK